MSRYGMNKVLKEVVLDDAAFRGYKEDRAGYLKGRDLTDDELRALLEFDYRWLYAAGAHPFLLNGFVMKAWPGDRATAQKTYLSSLQDLGYPDFAT